jgi:hypothetical protein
MIQHETAAQVDGGKSQPPSKMEKKQKNLYLSAQARQLLTSLSLNMGISETAVVELLLREKTAGGNTLVSPRIEPETQTSAP